MHTEPFLIWPHKAMTFEAWSAQDLATMLNTKPWWQYENKESTWRQNMRLPRLILNDGNSLSVQAGSDLYFFPHSTFGPYREVEVGFPSRPPSPLWDEYCEDLASPTKSIFTDVPIELVLFFVAGCGGINRDATFKNFSFAKPF